jgi:Na+-driven multidrug efflux pump
VGNIKMSNKKTEPKVAKQPKTVKVSTVVKTIIAIVVIILAFIGGILTANAYNHDFQAKVQSEAKSLAQIVEVKK